MRYTQDESYYILDTEEEEGTVWLGVKEGAVPEEMEQALRDAQTGAKPFDAARYVNCFPVKKHDHVLIPAGTIHGSGAGTMVLEISATPYIFTFKLWDWGRVDLDGKPRPIHIDHGMANIQWDRDTSFCQPGTHRSGRAGVHRCIPHHHVLCLGSFSGWKRSYVESGGGGGSAHYKPLRRICPLYRALRPDLYCTGGCRRLLCRVPHGPDNPCCSSPCAWVTERLYYGFLEKPSSKRFLFWTG